MTWVLILIVYTGNARGGVAVTTVPGFKYEAQCQAAGLAIAEKNNFNGVFSTVGGTFACVEQ